MHQFHDALVSFAERREIIMNKQQLIPSINYPLESIRLLQIIASDIDYDQMKKMLLSKYTILNTPHTRRLFSLL